MVLRTLRTLPVFGARRRAQHRDAAAGNLFPLLFEPLAPHLQCLRHGHAGAEPVTHGEAPGDTPATASDAASALERDASDPLASFAAEFHHPFDSAGRRVVYLCGHSLGLQPKSAAQYVEQELKDWQRLGVLGHHAAERPWIPYHEQAAAPLAALV